MPFKLVINSIFNKYCIVDLQIFRTLISQIVRYLKSFNRFKVVRLLAASGADPTRKIGNAKAPIEYITDEDAKKEVLHEYAGYKIYAAAQIGDVLMVRKFLIV